VIASLLAKAVFHDGHPDGALQTLAATAGLLGAGGLLLVVVLLLRPYELGFSVNAPSTYRALWEQGILEQPMVDLALADAFEEQREANLRAVRRLVWLLALALGALVLETAGLAAAAALAS
jgi:asparagine N-glycosylation enzyme membrane subunit Stt3